MAAAAVAHVATKATSLDELLQSHTRFSIDDRSMQVWDKGVFLNELLRLGIALEQKEGEITEGSLITTTPLQQGTYKGTRMALTELYSWLEDAATSHFDTMGIEPILPIKRDLSTKQKQFQWSTGADPPSPYPPHLRDFSELPEEMESSQDGKTKTKTGFLFDQKHQSYVSLIANAFGFLIPDEITGDHPAPYQGPTLKDCEDYNLANKSADTDVMRGMNLGMEKGWYNDARFAQQQLAGVNPTTLEKLTDSNKIKAYAQEAGKQKLTNMEKIISDSQELYIQDCSYFREATGLSNDELFESVVLELDKNKKPTGKGMSKRYACASVSIFELHPDGRLHPLAITLDYRGSLDKSITIFNQRLHPDDEGQVPEHDDWPWRYAKTCAQTADWARHEIAVHLTDTHMVEEAIIVATNRTIPEDHIIYQLLSPHWYRTLALNKGARDLLVPAVICRVAGFGPTFSGIDPRSRTLKLVDYSYKHFDFQGKYIPNDLKKRGFPNDDELLTNEKYRNYPYAKNMYLLWGVLRKFVARVLATKFESDQDIKKDPYIADWCKEIQVSGQLPSFPSITTVHQLVDAVTMIIHTASPEHTAVNYLQDYYYSFVPAKPSALCSPLPKDLAALQAYTVKDLEAALPIGKGDAKWKDWLLSAQLPELLSYKVDQRYNLLTYATSLYSVNMDRTKDEQKSEENFGELKKAAFQFYDRLLKLQEIFNYHSEHQTEGSIPYIVMDPETTAVSILI